jgi:hypothetical protein
MVLDGTALFLPGDEGRVAVRISAGVQSSLVVRSEGLFDECNWGRTKPGMDGEWIVMQQRTYLFVALLVMHKAHRQH